MADGFAFPHGTIRRGQSGARLPFLVTGGCGFIGARLTAALAARGEAVRVLDDLSNGSDALLPPGAEFVQGDIADPAVVRRAMQGVSRLLSPGRLSPPCRKASANGSTRIASI